MTLITFTRIVKKFNLENQTASVIKKKSVKQIGKNYKYKRDRWYFLQQMMELLIYIYLEKHKEHYKLINTTLIPMDVHLQISEQIMIIKVIESVFFLDIISKQVMVFVQPIVCILFI